MKKLLGTILLLAVVATHVAAQVDFSSQYLMRLKGNIYYGGDLSEGCGSRFDVYLVYEDGQVSHIVASEHGGGTRAFELDIFFESKNKVKQIVCYGRVYRQGSRWRSCGSRKVGEGNGYIDIDPNLGYPCFKQTFTGKFPYYDGRNTTVSVEIQPLSKKSTRLTMNADLRNNYNEDFANDPLIDPELGRFLFDGKSPFNFTIASQGGTSPETYWTETTDVAGGQTVSRQRIITYPSWPAPTSLKVSVGAYVNFGVTMGDEHATWDNVTDSRPVAAEFTLPLSDMVNPGTKTAQFTLFPNAPPSQVTLITTTYSLPIKYGPDDTNILPYKSRVTIVGPAWNPRSFYHWVYSLDGTTWKDLPARFQGQQRLQLSGYDIEGEDFMKNPIANRFVKLIVDCNGAESNILTLSGRISAPDITSVTPLPDRCFDKQGDGAFTITFATPLFVDSNGNREHLTILLKDPQRTDLTVGQFTDITLDAQNSFTPPRGLASDKRYLIELFDTYQGTAGYTGDVVNHRATFELVRPQPVSSVITPEAVHCYAGSGRTDKPGGAGRRGELSFRLCAGRYGRLGSYRYGSGSFCCCAVSSAGQLPVQGIRWQQLRRPRWCKNIDC